MDCDDGYLDAAAAAAAAACAYVKSCKQPTVKPKVVVITGAPGSGKDTLAVALARSGACAVAELKEQLLQRVRALEPAAWPIIAGIWCCTDPAAVHGQKDRPMAELGGRTPREMMISVSKRERALHGNDIFTRELMRTTLCCGTPGHTRLRPGQVWVVPDLGTDADFAALCEQFDAVHVHLTRAGCDYAKDSRRPLTHIPHLTLCNPGTPDFVPAAVARVRTLLV